MGARAKARLEAEIGRELAEIIATEVRDPVLQEALPDIVGVELSRDWRRATVYVYSGSLGKERVLGAFERDAGFLRSRLAQRVRIRRVPELSFSWRDPLEPLGP